MSAENIVGQIEQIEQAVLDWVLELEKNKNLNSSPEESFLNFKNLLKNLNLLDTPYPLVIIAGTNGKGSTAHGLSYFFRQAGYKTGLFTSPHLFSFNERICVNNQPAPEGELLEILRDLKNKVSPPLCPSEQSEVLPLSPGERRKQERVYLNYFQISCVLALEYFKNKNLDFGIFEIGIGGRFDCVNTLDSILSLICSISKDHMEILGESLEKIAEQKLGIARKDSPLFYADRNPQEIIMNNKIARYTEVYGRDFFYPEEFLILKKPKMAQENAALVLRAVDYLSGKFPKLLKNNKTDILNISAPGRLVLKEKNGFKILIDVAHNEDSVRRLKSVIEVMISPPLCPSISSAGLSLPKGERRKPSQIQAVFTAKPSKEIKKMIALLADLIQDWHVLNLCDIVFERLNLHHYESLRDAYEGALKLMEPGGLLVCFGSFTVASFVLKELEKP